MTNDYAATRLRRLVIEADLGENVEVLAVATVLWDGWELDNRVALLLVDGVRRLVTTNHGGLVACDVAELTEAKERHAAATATIDALLALASEAQK